MFHIHSLDQNRLFDARLEPVSEALDLHSVMSNSPSLCCWYLVLPCIYGSFFFRQDCRFDQVWLVIKYPYVSIHIHKYPYISININEYLWISMNMRNIHKYPPSLLSSKNLPRPPVQVAAPPFGRANLSCLPGCPGCTPFRIVDLQRAVTTFEFRYESHDGAMWAMVNTHG